MPQFMLILSETPSDFADVSPEEMQRIIERYRAWSDSLAERGAMVEGRKLRDEGGRVLSRNGAGVSAVDGPYAETREVVSGYFVIEAADYDDAVRLAGECPHLDFGRISVREVEPT